MGKKVASHQATPRKEEFVQITIDGSPINAHWNNFPSLCAAIKYFDEHCSVVPRATYGACLTRVNHWKFNLAPADASS